jgi:putative heme-binding domain-containing protein
MKLLALLLAGVLLPILVKAQSSPEATPAAKLTVLNGFKVELLHSPKKASEGSWVSMAIDPKGRLIVSPQDKQPLVRITLAGGKIASMETIDLPVSSSMGMLYAFDSLYVSGRGPNGVGLYRLRDTDNDDRYDKYDFLLAGESGEHGSHALVLGPDKMIYYMNGNFVKLPNNLAASSAHRNYADDQVLPRAEDGNGFGAGKKPPGGFVLRLDPEAKNIELFAAGMRNAYDFDFSPEGELFTFDSDMEWDWGTPWYRPVRVYHLVSGGDNGFREGTAKWPKWYHDALPPVVDIGIGSPTGVKFGTASNFPEKYKKALYIMDWTYGRIIAVHLKSEGASYTGSFENLVQGKPLNVTDMEFGQDGSLYFATGGRNTQSGLYRVSFAGEQPASSSSKAEQKAEAKAAEARALRHKLEAFHGKKDRAAIDFAWPHLDSEDRFIRYAARIAIEAQDVELWQNRALKEKDPVASRTVLLALARCGSKDLQAQIINALYMPRVAADSDNEGQLLEVLRATEVAFSRMGRPSPEIAQKVITRLDALYPAKSEPLNRELSQLLIFLEAPGVVQKTLSLLAKAETQEEQIHYAFHLRNLKAGWTLEDRRQYLAWFERSTPKKMGKGAYPGGKGAYEAADPKKEAKLHPPEVLQWFADVGRPYGDGASFPKFMINIRENVAATFSDADRAEFASFIAGTERLKKPATSVVTRKFVKDWKMADLQSSLDEASTGRSFNTGKDAFLATQCLACHRFGNEGGSVGPDITAISSRFSRMDLLSSIIEPSKVLSDQYQNMKFTLKDDDEITGRLLEETPSKLVLMIDPLTNLKKEIKVSDVKKREPSQISPMPEGLVSILTKEEILDLLAYIESGGKQSAAAFTQK